MINITTSLLLGIIAFTGIALVLLILFEGRTNKRIRRMLDRLDNMDKLIQQQNSRIDRLNQLVNEQDKDMKWHHYLSQGHNAPPFNSKRFAREAPAYIISQSLSLFQRIRKMMPLGKWVRSIPEQTAVSYVIGVLGVGVMAIGLTFYVKYTLDNELFNIVGKLGIGVLISGILLWAGHLWRKTYPAFASILLGGGIATQFYIISLAYYKYALFGAAPALSFMALLTATSFTIAVAYKRQELALLTIAAAFTAPFVVNFSHDNFYILFTYLLVIDLGVMILAYFRKWTIHYLITNFFTVIFFALWMLEAFQAGREIPVWPAMSYLSAFYLIFIIMHISWKVRKGTPFLPIELTFVISNTLVYYSLGYILLEELPLNYKGIFTAALAATNLVLMLVTHTMPRAAKGVKLTFFGLGLIFTVLIAPVEFAGKSITLVWAFQVILLLWLAQKIDVVLMRIGSLFMTVVMLTSLGIDMWDIYVSTSALSNPMLSFRNIGFFTNLSASVALVLNIVLLNNEKGEYFAPFIRVKHYKAFLGLFAGLVSYLTFYLEIRYALTQMVSSIYVIRLYLGIYNTGLLALLCLPVLFSRKGALPQLALMGAALSFVLYLAYYHFLFIHIRNAFLLSNLVHISTYRAHFVIIAILFLQLLAVFRALTPKWGRPGVRQFGLRWLAFLFLVILISSEADHYYIMENFREGLLPATLAAQAHKLLYTQIWTSLAGAFTLAGILVPNRIARQHGFVLLTAAGLKLLAYDLAFLSTQEIVHGFLSVGGTLLVSALLFHAFYPRIAKKNDT